MPSSSKQFMSATGRPFTDYDAACVKAAIMSNETGECFTVIDHHEGGYLVSLNDGATGHTSSICINQSTEVPCPDCTVEEMYPDEPLESVPEQRKKVKFTPPENGDPIDEVKTIKTHPSWMAHWLELFVAAIFMVIVLSPTGVALLFMDPGVIEKNSDWNSISQIFRSVATLMVMFLLSRVYFDVIINRYSVTKNEVKSTVGFIKRDTAQVRIQDIRTIDTRQGLIERLLDIGTLEFATAGTAGVDVVFKKISNPYKLKDEIERRTELSNERNRKD